METSTPNSRLRRVSVRNLSVSTPLRKSALNSSNSAALLEPADDEKERTNRRSFVTLQKKLTNISSTSSPGIDVTPVLAENEIKDHMNICLKLFAENKISAKNAWKLQIIDTMRTIMNRNNTNVLQVAGSSLDIGAKVYSLRVDDVHAKGLQLVSCVKTNEFKENEDNDNDNLDTTNTEGDKTKTRKKIKKFNSKDKRNTVDKSEKNLYCSHKHVDSAMFATKESIDISATDNLFTNKLFTNPNTHQLMLLSSDVYWAQTDDCILTQEDSILEIDIPVPKHQHICLPFKDFEISNWDPEEEEKLLNEGLNVSEVVLDADGIPIAEIDGSIHDIFEDNADHSDVEEQEVFQAQLHGEIAHIVDAVPEDRRYETEYGYNTIISRSGHHIEQIWAGPSHWKVKFNKPALTRFSGSAVQQVVKQTRKTKIPEKFDFVKLAKIPPETIDSYVIKRAPPRVSFEKITLPLPELELCLHSFEYLTGHLFFKPGVLRPRLKSKCSQDCDYEVKDYNYENPNDSQYLSQNSIIDNDEPPHNSFDEEMPPAAQEQFLEDNLVNAPDMVTQTHITYALQAKKMDMKKLKGAVWKCLISGSDDISDQAQVKIKETSFSTLYRTLPLNLNTEMKKELTCPLAVIALLHLCNENNLELIQNMNVNDFTIMKAVRKM